LKLEDKDIVKAIRADKEKGFRLLLISYKEPVYWHIRRIVVVHADAEDVAQETFLRIFRNFCQFDESNSLKAWIFRIATNESLRLLGKRKGKETLSLDDLTIDVIGRQADGYYDDSDQVAARLQKAIQQLPAKQQLAFNLRYYDEMAYEEIAQVAGSTAASMKMNYSIAKERIIRYINSNEEGI